MQITYCMDLKWKECMHLHDERSTHIYRHRAHLTVISHVKKRSSRTIEQIKMEIWFSSNLLTRIYVWSLLNVSVVQPLSSSQSDIPYSPTASFTQFFTYTQQSYLNYLSIQDIRFFKCQSTKSSLRGTRSQIRLMRYQTEIIIDRLDASILKS